MWAGRGVRIKQYRLPKRVLESCFGGGRSVGRPRNRWEDVIQRDAAKLLRIRNWNTAGVEEEGWGGNGTKTGRNAIEEEGEGEGEEEEEVHTRKRECRPTSVSDISFRLIFCCILFLGSQILTSSQLEKFFSSCFVRLIVDLTLYFPCLVKFDIKFTDRNEIHVTFCTCCLKLPYKCGFINFVIGSLTRQFTHDQYR
jgi:hypothetical protein